MKEIEQLYPKKTTCQVETCGRNPKTRGYCSRHYQQIRRYGKLTPEREYVTMCEERPCRSPSCSKIQIAKGYCYRHYQQIRRHGRLTPEREIATSAL